MEFGLEASDFDATFVVVAMLLVMSTALLVWVLQRE